MAFECRAHERVDAVDVDRVRDQRGLLRVRVSNRVKLIIFTSKRRASTILIGIQPAAWSRVSPPAFRGIGCYEEEVHCSLVVGANP